MTSYPLFVFSNTYLELNRCVVSGLLLSFYMYDTGQILWKLGNHIYQTLYYWAHSWAVIITEPPHDKTNKVICAPSEDSDQPKHPPSPIRGFAVRSIGRRGPNVSSCGQRRLWSNGADAQAELSLPWAQMSFCWFCHKPAQMWHCSCPLAVPNAVRVLYIRNNPEWAHW